MKRVLAFAVTLLLATSSWATPLKDEIRGFIQYHNQKYPKNYLYMDVLNKMLGPNGQQGGEIPQIYTDAETQYRASLIADQMEGYLESRLGFSDYEETLDFLLQVYFEEPENRRAIQAILDAIRAHYHNQATQTEEYDSKNWGVNVVDNVTWFWGVLTVGALATYGPANRFGGRVLSKTFHKTPMPSRLRQGIRSKVMTPVRNGMVRYSNWRYGEKTPYYEMGSFRRIMTKVSRTTIGRLTVNTALLGTGATATGAAVGTLDWLMYRSGTWGNKRDPDKQLSEKYQQIALFKLACDTYDLEKLVTDYDWSQVQRRSSPDQEISANLVKKELNALVDEWRFLYETGFLFGTSQKIHPEIQWSPKTNTISFNDRALEGPIQIECAALDDKSKEEFRRSLINLMPLKTVLQRIIHEFETSYNRVQLDLIDKSFESFLNDYGPQLRNLYKSFTLENSGVTSVETTSLSAEDLGQAMTELTKVNTEPMDQFPQYSEFKTFSEQVPPEVQEAAKSGALELFTRLDRENYNSKIVTIFTDRYVPNSSERVGLGLVFFELSKILQEERKLKVVNLIEHYPDPLKLLSLLHDRGYGVGQ